MNPRLRELSSSFLNERHALLSFIHGLVRDNHAAEDIFQEVWLRLADAAERNVEILEVSKWCRGVAKNLILHHWRDVRQSKVVADSEFVDLVETSFVEQETSQDHWRSRQQALRKCLEVLPDGQKNVLRLKYDEELTAEAVAARVGKSVASVMMALSRLRRALGKCAEEKLAAANA